MLAVLEAVYKLDARLESQLFTEKILILASFQRFVICACLIFRSVLDRLLLFVFIVKFDIVLISLNYIKDTLYWISHERLHVNAIGGKCHFLSCIQLPLTGVEHTN